MAFESGVTNPGSGGLVLCVSTFTDSDAVARTLPFSGIAFGAIDAIPTPVTSSAGLPVAQQGTWTVDVTGVATAANQVTANTSLASIDGKITVCNTGSVTVASSALPSGASTAANQATIISGLVSIDSHVDGLEASASSIDGKITACNTGNVTIGAALPAGTNAIGKLAANAGVTIGAVEIAASQTLAALTSITNVVHVDDNAGSLTVDYATTGSGTVTGALRVELANNGTGALSTVATVTTCSTVTTLTGSSIAHDAVDSGSPHKIGARATASLSAATMVAAADRSDIMCGVDGVLINRPHCNLEDIVRGNATITDGSSTSVISAAGAGVKIYVQSVTISNTSATAVEVDLRDGTGGSVLWTYPVPANTSGIICNFPIPLPFSANTAVAADPSAAASSIKISILGFKSKI